MDLLLPYIDDREHFMMNANLLGFTQFSARRFLYINFDSDNAEVHPSIIEQRLLTLLYAWKLCERYKVKQQSMLRKLQQQKEFLLQKVNSNIYNLDHVHKNLMIDSSISLQLAPIRYILKIILPCSLQIWFGHELESCHKLYRNALLHCLVAAKDLLNYYYPLINWTTWFQLGPLPFYNCPYLLKLNKLTVNDDRMNTTIRSIETMDISDVALTDEDVEYVQKEQLAMITLRAMKLLSSNSFQLLKTYCMRVISVWMERTSPKRTDDKYSVNTDEIFYLINICHFYMMAVYETDKLNGLLIDNLVDDVTFYLNMFYELGWSEGSYDNSTLLLTPARNIALLCDHIRVRRHQFFTTMIDNIYDRSLYTTVGNKTILAYRVYLLAHHIMQLHLLPKTIIIDNYAAYKELFANYLTHRKLCDKIIIGNVLNHKSEPKANEIYMNTKRNTNYNEYCASLSKAHRIHYKGNFSRTFKIFGSLKDTENCEELIVDPVFSTLPNNNKLLYDIKSALSKKSINNWYYGKIMVLLKIIYVELDSVEMHRYTSGTETKFMIELDKKLSRHYEELANIFRGGFLEREFWLTAFYLNPKESYYGEVLRCGAQSMQSYLLKNHQKSVKYNGNCNLQQTPPELFNAKYDLLSSTADVKYMAKLTNDSTLYKDYQDLNDALKSLLLPETVIRDMLSVIFIPRNKTYSWATSWNELRTRCTKLYKRPSIKNRLIEMNMIDANARLKNIDIDYNKYKNRPQLDYGTIEAGYEKDLIVESSPNDYQTYDDEDNCNTPDENSDTDDGNNYINKSYEQEFKNVIQEDPKSPINETAFTSDEEQILDKEKEESEYHRVRTRAQRKLLHKSTKNKSKTESNNNNENNNENKQDMVDVCNDEAPTPIDIKSIEENNSDMSFSDNKTLLDSNLKNMPDNVEGNCDEVDDANAKQSLDVILKKRPVFTNNTPGFRPIIDIWSVTKTDYDLVDTKYVCYTECIKLADILQDSEDYCIEIEDCFIKYDIPSPITVKSKPKKQGSEKNTQQNNVSKDNLTEPKASDSNHSRHDNIENNNSQSNNKIILMRQHKQSRKAKPSKAQSKLEELCKKEVRVNLEKLTVYNLPLLRQPRVVIKPVSAIELSKHNAILPPIEKKYVILNTESAPLENMADNIKKRAKRNLKRSHCSSSDEDEMTCSTRSERVEFLPPAYSVSLKTRKRVKSQIDDSGKKELMEKLQVEKPTADVENDQSSLLEETPVNANESDRNRETDDDGSAVTPSTSEAAYNDFTEDGLLCVQYSDDNVIKECPQD